MAQFVKSVESIRGYKPPVPIPETPSAIHSPAQRNAVRRDARFNRQATNLLVSQK